MSRVYDKDGWHDVPDDYQRPVTPDMGRAWATGWGVESYDAASDLVKAWLQLRTEGGETVRIPYAIMGSVTSHEEFWPDVAAGMGYTLMPGPPLLDE